MLGLDFETLFEDTDVNDDVVATEEKEVEVDVDVDAEGGDEELEIDVEEIPSDDEEIE